MIEFTKWHGLGNDFVICDTTETGMPENPQDLAVKICHRHFGVGADGLVLLLRADGEADIEMRIYNADGSEAEMCGNAIRCIALQLFQQGRTGPKVKVKTLAGMIVPEVIPDPLMPRVRVNMGVPRLERSEIPMLGDPGKVIGDPVTAEGSAFCVTAVSMGNPHCIVFVDDTDAVDLARWGPILENHPLFPRKTNVEFVQVLAPDRIKVRVWERGAGPTLACGTGASAAAVAAVLNGFTGRVVDVLLPGGTLAVEWADDGAVYMTGPAVEVFRGEYLLAVSS